MSELTPEHERMLEECLRSLEGGTSVEDCLSRYPDAADDLRPYLELRASLVAAGQLDPPAGAYEQGRSRLLTQLETKPSVLAATPFCSGIGRFFSGEQRWGGGLARAAAGVIAVFVLGFGALGASAAGGFEPARDALEPARDVLSALRIIPNDNETHRRVPDERPTEGEAAGPTDAPADAEGTREPERNEPVPTVCDRSSDRPCVDEERLTPTPGRDARATEAPRTDVRTTATPARDAPRKPVDRVATPERPLDVAPSEPPRNVEPTSTSSRDGEQSDRPLDDASNDTRSAEPDPTIGPREEDLTIEEATARPGSIERLDGWPGDVERGGQP